MPASGSAGTGVTAVPAESSDQLLLPLAGPWICVARPVVKVRPSSVHTAPVSPHGAATARASPLPRSCEDGSIRICQWSS